MSDKQNIQNLMNGFTAETTPGSAAKIESFRNYLRSGTAIYVTFLPGSDFNDTVAVAKRIREEGLVPVPHFAARSIKDKNTLNEYLTRVVAEAGVDHVLCIAGAIDSPVGEFTDSTKLLATGLFDKHNIKKIGVAGHPEGSPDMSDESILKALKWKNSFAEQTDAQSYLITQFAFEVNPIITWDKHLQAEGNKLPIHIGIPGLATLKTLLKHAKACGIGPSMKFLTKQAKNVSRLLTTSTPDIQVRGLANYIANNSESSIAGLHVYPLGGLRRSAIWSYAVADGQFTLDSKGGFKVDIDVS